jgi:Domain of unknown function (DUF4335)
VFITNNIIRRYTPPTCTLEIQGKSSPLSRFKGNNLVRNLWFQLSFGDPKLPEELRVKICGDRFQLEELCEVVNEYVHKFLAQTPWENKLVTANSSPEAKTKPYLQQKGLLDHELYCVSIARTKERKIVKLTSTELFDLANALDDFARDITLLPAEKETSVRVKPESKLDLPQKRVDRPKNPRKLPAWTSVAASFLLATGATIAGMHFYYQSQSTTNTSVAVNPTTGNSSLTPTPTTDENKDNSVPPPPTTKTIPIPSISLSPSLSNNDTPPPPVTIETPKTNQQSRQNSNSVNTKEDLFSQNQTPTSTNQATTNKNQQIDRNLNSKTRSSSNRNNTNNNNVATTIISDLPETQPIEIPTNTPSETTTTTKTTEAKIFSGYTPNPSNTESFSGNPPASINVPNNPVTRINVPDNSAAIDTSPTVNTVTQVEQVQQYFQGRWQPPTELKEALQYNLSISNSGSLQNITPVGKTAATYLDRTNMPLLNESFVSPSNTTDSIRVRLVLNPDGTVQTFKE